MRGSEYKGCRALGTQLDGAVGLLEDRDLSALDSLRRNQSASVYGEPRDAVIVRRRVHPALAALQSDVEVVDALRRPDAASRHSVLTQNHANRTVLLDGIGRDVLTLRWRKLFLFRQRDPQLEDAQWIALKRPAVMPDALARFHPLETALPYLAFLACRVLVGEAALQDCRQRGDARVRMNPGERLSRERHFGVIEEHERLDHLADARRADQARDRAVPAAGAAEYDSARRGGRGKATRDADF